MHYAIDQLVISCSDNHMYNHDTLNCIQDLYTAGIQNVPICVWVFAALEAHVHNQQY